MVIDAANGVEAQTRRLIEVCRQRNTPIITFVNKMDRSGADFFNVVKDVETKLKSNHWISPAAVASTNTNNHLRWTWQVFSATTPEIRSWGNQ
jgi:peptide subunit release factor RF-3